jgi:hypothetical protein
MVDLPASVGSCPHRDMNLTSNPVQLRSTQAKSLKPAFTGLNRHKIEFLILL